VVQQAVVSVLAAADGPMRHAAIHAAVESQLKQSVSKESVSWCLLTGCRGNESRFERVTRGSIAWDGPDGLCRVARTGSTA